MSEDNPNQLYDHMTKAMNNMSDLLKNPQLTNIMEALKPSKQYPFVVNGKECKLTLNKMGSVNIEIENPTDADLKEMVKRLLGA